MTHFAHAFPSPCGPLIVTLDEEGTVLGLGFQWDKHSATSTHRTAASAEPAVWDAERARPVVDQLEAYFRGERRAFDLTLAPRGTAFQQAVWAALLEIPYGTTTTYGALARRLGQPGAVRAVGRANGANPIAIVVPCHRVIGQDGSLTGYGGGLAVKRMLLALEGAMLPGLE